MDKKCICFCRVSTTQQSLDEQRDKVIATAIADGYSRDEITVVEGKESAIKLKEEQRETLNEMKQIINDNPSIESVYVFAIDRLARRVSVIMSVKEYLTERGINLVFLNPHKMGTLRKDEKTGDLIEDELTNLLLMLLSYGADMEMKITKARFQTAKDALKAQGKLATGSVLYGYYRADDGSAKIKNDEAEIVRYIYSVYLNEKISLQGLFKKLVREGKWEKTIRINSAPTKIRQILTNPAYCGGTPKQRTKGKEGVERAERYPAIISKEMQDAVIHKLKENVIAPKSISKTIYYGKGLVKYQTENGKEFTMSPIRRNIQYSIKNEDAFASISCNVIDSILWDEAITLKRHYLNLDRSTTKEAYIKTIEDNNKKIAKLHPKLDKIRKKQQQAFRMLMKGAVSEGIYNDVMKEVEEDETTLAAEIAKLETANTNMKLIIDEMSNAAIVSERNLASIEDDGERAEIIKSVVEKVIVKKVNDERHTHHIEVVPKDILLPFYKSHIWEYWVRGGVFHLFLLGSSVPQTRIIQKRIKPYERK